MRLTRLVPWMSVVLVATTTCGPARSAAQPAPAAEQKPDWIADPRTGCRVWNPSPSPTESITWDGPCAAGVPSGRGRLQWFTAGAPTRWYEGGCENGKRHGQGIETFANGGRYEGEYQDGTFHGRGVFRWPDGGRYEGEYRNGRRHGRGIFRWPDGGSYDGDWQENRRHGRGVRVFANGNRYDGEWRDNRPNGLGTYTTSKGNTLSGSWINGCARQGDRWATVEASPEECGVK